MIPTDPPEISGVQWQGLSGKLAYDVGAHLGENFAFLRAAGAEQIIALEPFPELYGAILARLDGDVSLYQAAAWDSMGHVELVENDGMLGLMMGTQPLRVAGITLDFIAETRGMPDLVVVDTEGCEERVLRGAQQVIAAAHPSWLIEFHSEELYAACWNLLAAAGYEVQVIRHPHYTPGTPMWRGHGWLKALR